MDETSVFPTNDVLSCAKSELRDGEDIGAQHGRAPILSLLDLRNEVDLRSFLPVPLPRVLVVDDVPDIRFMLGKLVERMGYEVEIAACGLEALEVLMRRKIDLVITDWAMPGMSGGDLISTLKQQSRWRNIPTIVLTGHDMERDEAMFVGCDRFLIKPVKCDQLHRAIVELIERNDLWKTAQKSRRDAVSLRF
jgi:CheY-like chemotaxis protein